MAVVGFFQLMASGRQSDVCVCIYFSKTFTVISDFGKFWYWVNTATISVLIRLTYKGSLCQFAMISKDELESFSPVDPSELDLRNYFLQTIKVPFRPHYDKTAQIGPTIN